MDSVQRFISENQHQFGYIMSEASRQWIAKDPKGAFTVGDCNFVIEKYGEYHEILEKLKRYEEVLKNISLVGDDYSRAMAKGSLDGTLKVVTEKDRLQAFYDYFSELYGKGLEIANWHQNDTLEPFDSFFDAAEQEME